MSATEPEAPDPDHLRYAEQVAFPPYRYVPGRAPHPIKHSEGHLFGRGEVPPPYPTQIGWHASEAHRAAVDLFNHAYWWEAHEAWEGLWHQAPKGSPERDGLRGLIQAAAALLKGHMETPRARDRLAASALRCLHAAVTHQTVRGMPVLALDLSDFAQRFDAHVHRAGAYPFLTLVPPARARRS